MFHSEMRKKVTKAGNMLEREVQKTDRQRAASCGRCTTQSCVSDERTLRLWSAAWWLIATALTQDQSPCTSRLACTVLLVSNLNVAAKMSKDASG